MKVCNAPQMIQLVYSYKHCIYLHLIHTKVQYLQKYVWAEIMYEARWNLKLSPHVYIKLKECLNTKKYSHSQ